MNKLKTIINRKIERINNEVKELEVLFNENRINALQKQDYIGLKAKKQAYEDILDIL